MTQAMAKTVRTQLQSQAMTQVLRDAVPVTARKYLTPERIVRIVTTSMGRNPKLMSCKPESILRSVVDCVQLGLEPSGPLGHAYLVPYKESCTPIIGYQGYLELARRSGEIDSIFAHIIYSRDTYEVSYGDNPTVQHAPRLKGDRGEPVAVYCVARFKGGGKHIEVMTVDEVEGIRQRSFNRDKGPWVTDWGQMARKTVIRRARHYWPVSTEMAEAAELEDRVDSGSYQTDSEPLPLPEPEVVETRTEKVKQAAKKSAPKKKDDEPPPPTDNDAPDYGTPDE